MQQHENGNISVLIDGCVKHDRKSQQLLYRQFYAYGMSICIRYTRNEQTAMEVLNDAFMKVFTAIEKFDRKRSFKSWFRRILINTSINAIRKEAVHQHQLDVNEVEIRSGYNQDQELSHRELIQIIQRLSPAYRSVFNLYVIDGYKHDEIAAMLDISVGTSKSNLAKARMRLKEILSKINKNELVRFAR